MSKKITELDAATVLAGANIIPIVQGTAPAVTKRTTLADLAAFTGGGGGGGGAPTDGSVTDAKFDAGAFANLSFLQRLRVNGLPRVKSATTTTPPGAPTALDAYYVPTGATGAWASNVGKIVVWDGTSIWTPLTLNIGEEFYVDDAAVSWVVKASGAAVVSSGSSNTSISPTGNPATGTQSNVVFDLGSQSLNHAFDFSIVTTTGFSIDVSGNGGSSYTTIFGPIAVNSSWTIGGAKGTFWRHQNHFSWSFQYTLASNILVTNASGGAVYTGTGDRIRFTSTSGNLAWTHLNFIKLV